MMAAIATEPDSGTESSVINADALPSRTDKALSLVVPVYLNAGSLPSLYERLTAIERQLQSQNMGLELIFVDDGSGDASLAELLRIKSTRPNTRIIKLTRNFGTVAATKCGLRFVTGDCFMILAADLQVPPELILQVVEKWRSGSRFTICQRISGEDPFLATVWARVFYWLIHHLVMRDYPHGGFDAALMDRALLPHILHGSKNLYTPLLAYWLGYKPDVLYYRRQECAHDKSWRIFEKKFKLFLDVLLGFSVTPIRLISAVGAVVAILSFGYGVLVGVNALLGNVPVAGFASLVALITFLLGLVIVMLGVIGEYVWRIFDELNKRPEVAIDEVY